MGKLVLHFILIQNREGALAQRFDIGPGLRSINISCKQITFEIYSKTFFLILIVRGCPDVSGLRIHPLNLTRGHTGVGKRITDRLTTITKTVSGSGMVFLFIM
jgi:hypothetical protein